MESNVIMEILHNDNYSSKYNPQFCLIDSLPMHLEDNTIYVVFTAPSNARPSKDNIIRGHVFSIDTIQRGTTNIPVLTVFDSYGRFSVNFPPPRIRQIIFHYCKKRNASLYVNARCYQAPRSIICSHLTLYFLLQRSRGHGLACIQKSKFCSNQRKLLFLIPKLIKGLIPPKISKKERVSKNPV